MQGADCAAGELCVLGRCQAGVACEQDGDCIAPRLCIDRACVETPFCVGDADCIGARICEAGTCGDGCGDDMDCSLGDVCEAGRCVSPVECQIDIDCDAGERCDAGSCVSVGECQVDGDCDAGEICEADTCRAGCRIDDDCPGNQVCDPADFDCREPMVCADDVDCLGGRECVDGACQEPVLECVGDPDCPGAGQCNDGVCFGVQACQGNDECIAPLRCLDGFCALPAVCADDGDCRPGQVCNDISGACEDALCPALPVLEEGVARPRTIAEGDQRLNLDCPAIVRQGAEPGDAWRFNLGADGAVSVQVAGLAANVWILDGCTFRGETVLSCGAAPLDGGNLPAGDYTIIVEGAGGATGDYDITVQVAR